MPRKLVRLRSPKEMPRALAALERVVYGEMLKALRKTARYAETKTVRTARSTNPKPLAHGAYMNAWGVQETPTGAIMGNSAYHSYFVEVGRKPGRKPPLAPIINWINAKRISPRRMKATLGYSKVSLSDSKNPKARSKARRKRTNRLKRQKLVRSYAFYVQYVIGRYGTKGRYVLRRAMPAIQKRFKKELKKSLKIAITKYRG